MSDATPFSADECEARAETALQQALETGSNQALLMELYAESSAWSLLGILKRSGFVRQENMHGTTVRAGE